MDPVGPDGDGVLLGLVFLGVVRHFDANRREVEVVEVATVAPGVTVVRRALLGAGNGGQFLEDLCFMVLGQIVAAARGLNQVRHDVAGPDPQRQQRWAHLDAALPHEVEHGLEGVGEGNQPAEAEGAGAALDRVDRAEGGVEQLHVRGTLLQRDQLGLEVAQELVALLEEGLLELFESVHIQPWSRVGFDSRGRP